MALSATSIMRFALRIRDWILSLLSIILLILVVFWISCFLWGSFYFAYMPSEQSKSIEAHFGFDPCQKNEENRHKKCSFPKAEIDFGENAQIYFFHGQKYAFSLDIEAPPSPRNSEAGMIQICAEIEDENENILRSSCRSTLMPFKNAYLIFMEWFSSSLALNFDFFSFLEKNQSLH